MAMQDTAEVMLAKGLLLVEPEKIGGGSRPRRDWLGLVLEVQMYLHQHGGNTEAFRDALLGIEVIFGDEPRLGQQYATKGGPISRELEDRIIERGG